MLLVSKVVPEKTLRYHIIMTDVKANLEKIQTLIADYEKKYQREPGSVRLLGASKGQSPEKIQTARSAGLHCFGENYLQEALEKIEILNADPSQPSLEWHFIGPIQSNKTRKIAEHFDWVQSISSEKIVKRLSDQRPASLPPLNICIEINSSNEPSKSGLHDKQEIISLAKYCLALPRIRLRGLMAIPAPQTDFTEQRAAFREVHQLWQQLRQEFPFDTLSIGMSGDFEAAIAEGSTLVRIGTAIFGQR